MALFRTGYCMLKTLTPVLTSPAFFIPSSVNNQVRNAARKGYREKKLRLKLAQKKKKLEAASSKDQKQQSSFRNRQQSIKKTLDLKKPEPPNDDVYIIENFNYKKYTLAEAVQFHKEYHHPTVFNNPEALITVRFDINMTGKKETQVLKPFSGLVAIRHPFVIKHIREVMVFCQPEDVQMCLECGAGIAGGADLIKKVQEGIILPSAFDYVIAHTSILPDLTPIRGLLKDQLPRAKKGNLTDDLKPAIAKFLHGIEYKCEKFESAHNFGVISAAVGKVDMPNEHIEDNFKALVEDILKNRPNEERDFITWIWCLSPPSDECFALDISKYIPGVTKTKDVTENTKVKKKNEAKILKKKIVTEDEEEPEVVKA